MKLKFNLLLVLSGIAIGIALFSCRFRVEESALNAADSVTLYSCGSYNPYENTEGSVGTDGSLWRKPEDALKYTQQSINETRERIRKRLTDRTQDDIDEELKKDVICTPVIFKVVGRPK